MAAKTATKSETSKVAKATVKAAPKATVLPAATQADIIKFNQAKAMIKEFTAQKEAAELAIRTALGDSTVGILNGEERVVLSPRANTYINAKLLLESFPEAYTATSYVTEFTVLVTK